MRRNVYGLRLAVTVFLCSTMAFAATARQWHSGKLMDSEQQKVNNGSTTTYNTDGQANNRNGKYSQNTTARTTDDVDTFEVYTIEGAGKTYVAREKLWFPWSKPANVAVGGEIKYAISGRTMYILDDDQKEHKASIVKTSLHHAQ